MSDDISDSGKFPNNYFESFEAYIERIFSLIAIQKPVKRCRTLQLNRYHARQKFQTMSLVTDVASSCVDFEDLRSENGQDIIKMYFSAGPIQNVKPNR